MPTQYPHFSSLFILMVLVEKWSDSENQTLTFSKSETNNTLLPALAQRNGELPPCSAAQPRH
jgi:hypothetical protein